MEKQRIGLLVFAKIFMSLGIIFYFGCASSSPQGNILPPGRPTSNRSVAIDAGSPQAQEPRRTDHSADAAVAPSGPLPSIFFSEVAKLSGDYRLLLLDRDLFIVGDQYLARVQDGKLYPLKTTATDMGLKPHRGWLRGVGGKWPSALWAFAAYSTLGGNATRGRLYRFQNNRWRRIETLPSQVVYLSVAQLSNGTVVALRGAGTNSGGHRVVPKFSPLTRWQGGKLPEFATYSKKQSCIVKASPLAMTVVKTGYLFVLGESCELNPIIQWWRPGERVGQLFEPQLGKISRFLSTDEPVLAARSAQQLYVSSGGYFKPSFLLHFDGTKWKSVPQPSDRPITSLALAPDGSLWAATRFRRMDRSDEHSEVPSTLWRKDAGGSWEPIVLPYPKDADPKRLIGATSVALTAEYVWVVSSYSLWRAPLKHFGS